MESLSCWNVRLVLTNGLQILFPGANPIPFRLIDSTEVHVRIAVTLVSGSLKGTLEPGNSGVGLALHDEIRTDVVVRIAEIGIDLNGFMAFGNSVVDQPHGAVGPAQER